jgi:hypothetical protein
MLALVVSDRQTSRPWPAGKNRTVPATQPTARDLALKSDAQKDR